MWEGSDSMCDAGTPARSRRVSVGQVDEGRPLLHEGVVIRQLAQLA